MDLYPKFQAWLRNGRFKVLAIWGQHDQIFVKEGAEAFRKDVGEDRLELKWIDAGHFALETNEEEVAGLIGKFLERAGI